MAIHHRTWFPFVLAGLTLSLVLLVVYAYGTKEPSRIAPSEEAVSAPTDAEYQAALASVMSGFLVRLDAAEGDAARLSLVEDAQSKVLALIVPGDRRELHLEIAISLNLLRTGLGGDATAYVEGRRRLQAVIDQYSWLR
jgi:hypothetical protein